MAKKLFVGKQVDKPVSSAVQGACKLRLRRKHGENTVSKGGDNVAIGKVPKNALTFMEQEEGNLVQFAREGDKRRVTMLGYSGGVIKGHWYWGDLAIDVAGVQFSKPVIPILEQHDLSRKIGFSKKPNLSDNQIFFEDINVLDTPEAQQFLSNAEKGFPYQASISGKPLVIEQLSEGQKAEVNGYTLKGPATIWRKTAFRECSVVVFGADGNTNTKVANFAENELEEVEVTALNGFSFNKQQEEVSMPFDLKKELAENPEQFEEYAKGIRSSVETEFQAKLKEKDDLIAQLQADKTKTEEELSEQKTAMSALDKKVTLLREESFQAKADAIWKEEFGQDNVTIPEHLHQKVQAHVTYSKFVKEDQFDEASFRKAVQDELAEWSKGMPTQVKGSGTSMRETDEAGGGNDFDEKPDESTQKRLAAYLPKTE